MHYSSTTLQLFSETEHAGDLAAGSGVCSGSAVSPSNHDAIKLYLQLENEIIIAARFQANANVATIACAEYLCRWCEGKSLTVVRELTAEQMIENLELAKSKIHSANLALSALKNALKMRDENEKDS